MKTHLAYFVRAGTDWLFRRRSPALILVKSGIALLALLLTGWAFNISMPTKDGVFSLSFGAIEGWPVSVTYGLLIVAGSLIAFGVVWEWRRYCDERRRQLRKKVIVIEARGLRDSTGTPLVDCLPESIEGQREQILLDMRQGIRDGLIVDPTAAIKRLVGLPQDLQRRMAGLDRQDLTTVFGGLMPVPLTFLTGVLIDDEQAVVIMDWNRYVERWCAIDAVDDGKRFNVIGLDMLPSSATEVALAVSVSYQVDLSGISRMRTQMPVVRLDLVDGSPDCHWSPEKQTALAKQFFEVVVRLGNIGVRRIHMFLAAQSSVVFRFGRIYDKRNLPHIVVYQYERGSEPPFPWGVLMPAGGIDHAAVIRE